MPPKTRPGSKTAGARPQNIQELAKIAGVSTATVSRALTGAGHLSTATRERIQKLAAELQFKPSMTARNLRIGRTGAIGVVVPLGHERTQHLSDPFFMTLISHVADRLADHGYDVLLSRVVPTDGNWLDRIAQSGRVDGIIVIGQSDQALVLDEAAKSYKPMVVWGSRIEGHAYHTVGSDNRLGGRLATEHLLAQGCRKLAFFGDPNVPEVEERLTGFREAIKGAGEGVAGALLPVHFVPDMALATISEYLGVADGVDGIFAASDTIAMMTIQALAERGRVVPSDVKVVGFDDLEIARHTLPPLTSIRQDLGKGAEALVDTLLALMRDEDAPSVLLTPTLTPRASTTSGA
ncbi:substrate-binding domain-containing protein [Caulobacter segnis]|uniref:LacI family DNA-binding transcriptional regulator n=1 Tax=Caulobacter segnis TaxID=88688 RepID=UPI0028586323|nr:substrate-binding domain-containing protein [Caulobacter segnis]MDR6626885.1 DNA-binding LacI/PurR family transcriptional regulator [Caulobacter segnis]